MNLCSKHSFLRRESVSWTSGVSAALLWMLQLKTRWRIGTSSKYWHQLNMSILEMSHVNLLFPYSKQLIRSMHAVGALCYSDNLLSSELCWRPAEGDMDSCETAAAAAQKRNKRSLCGGIKNNSATPGLQIKSDEAHMSSWQRPLSQNSCWSAYMRHNTTDLSTVW